MLSGHLEQAGKWLWGTYNYWEVTAEARQYTRVARSFVWADRLHLGNHRCTWRFVQRSILQAVLPRGRDEHPGLGSL